MVNKINPVNRLYRLLSQVNQTIVRVGIVNSYLMKFAE